MERSERERFDTPSHGRKGKMPSEKCPYPLLPPPLLAVKEVGGAVDDDLLLLLSNWVGG